MHTHLHTYIHTYIHTHIHAYIHIDRHRVCSLAKCNNAKHHFMDGWMYYAAKRRKAMRYQAMRHDVNANIYSLQQTAVHAYIYTYIHTYISICANTLSTEYIYLYIYVYIYIYIQHRNMRKSFAWHSWICMHGTEICRALPLLLLGLQRIRSVRSKRTGRLRTTAYIHIDIHTYIHTYMHTYIHTYTAAACSHRYSSPLLKPSTAPHSFCANSSANSPMFGVEHSES